MKNLISLVALLAQGASFIASIISLFNGQLVACAGLLILCAVFGGIANGKNGNE